MNSSCIISTPFCDLKIHCEANKVASVEFIKGHPASKSLSSDLLSQVDEQLKAYSQSSRFRFDLPLVSQGTDFQQRVWAELRKIPSGQVRTYGEIAEILGSSPRAVGNACRKNPVPVIVPCHRVVSKTGIGGFSGATGGEYLKIKRRLLAHEGVEID
jgi:methylated-DNA-[protein]-cysteine S-methyltransferase